MNIPYKKLSNTKQSFYGGFYYSSTNNGGACLSISKTEIADYGLNINGIPIDTRTHEIYYR